MRIIAGRLKNREIYSPKSNLVRPVSARARKAIFDILNPEIKGAVVLDLYCGSGIFGIEAISRGSAFAHFVDLNVKLVLKNIEKYNLSDVAAVHRKDVGRYIRSAAAKNMHFDIIFVDPPWPEIEQAAQVFSLLDNPDILQPGGRMMLKIPEKFDAAQSFHNISIYKEKIVGNAKLVFLRCSE